MKTEIDSDMNKVNQLKEVTDALQREINSQLQPLANSSLQGIETLGNSVVALYQAPDKSAQATENQIATCKSQSKVVAKRFTDLHAKSTEILQRAGDVSLTPLVQGNRVTN
jgi:chaperonin cofactor prefoldin